MLQEQSAVAGPREGGAEREGGSRVERWLLVAIVLTMILLPTLEAVLRRAVGGSFPDAIPYTTHLTLWVGFVGAMLATATERHLALSTVELLPERLRTAARGYGHVVGALVMAVLAYASVKMIVADHGRVDTLAGGVPEWWFEIIMPVGFAVMALRSVREQIKQRVKLEPAGSKWVAQAEALLPALDALEEKFHNPKAKVAYDILAMKGGARLYSQLVPLYNTLMESDAALTQGIRETYAEHAKELKRLEAQWQELVDGDLRRLNELARDQPALSRCAYILSNRPFGF